MEVSAKLLARRKKIRAAFEAGVSDRAALRKRLEALNHGKLHNFVNK